jgi:hypothetical protein
MSLDRWFIANQLVLNITKTNVIKFTPKTIVHVPLGISYKNYDLDEVNSTKFFGIHIDSHMNWKIHIEQISHKLSVACFKISNLTHTLNTDILRKVYFAHFQPVIQYGIILGGNSAHAQQVLKLQKRVIRIMSGTGPRCSCRNLFKKFNILPVPSPYILSLMLFIIENQQDFHTSACVHGLDARNKNHLYLPSLSLTCVQKGVLYSGIEIFNNLPSTI